MWSGPVALKAVSMLEQLTEETHQTKRLFVSYRAGYTPQR
jgi:hypothetical protein